MATDSQIDWHAVFGDILDGNMSILAGSPAVFQEREISKFIRLDYYCELANPTGRRRKDVPFSHFKKYNVIEFKSYHESLNVNMLRNYLGRALLVENMDPTQNRRGQTTLTVITCRKPSNILKSKDFNFEKVEPWLYRSKIMPSLDFYLIVIPGMRGIMAGEPMALLQTLDGNPNYRKKTWRGILTQNLANPKRVKRIIMRIDKEAAMSILEEERKEGRKEGREEGQEQTLRATLRDFVEVLPETVRGTFDKTLKAAKSLSDLLMVQQQIKQQILAIRKTANPDRA